MKQSSFLILLMLSLAFMSEAQLPDAKWTRVRKIDIRHIAIDLQFDWKQRQAMGKADITLSLLNSGDRFSLDAGMLTINQIKLTNGISLKFTYDGSDRNDALSVELDRTYQSGEEIIISIEYHTNWINEYDPNAPGGSNGKGLRFFQPTATEPKRKKQIWSMGEPESNRYWFPGYDSPSDFRTTEFRATVEKDLTVISNGKLTERKDNTDGTHTFHYKEDTPYANHLTSFIVGEYTDVSQNQDGISLRNYSYKDEAEATEVSVERLPDMIRFYSDYTGVKYPHSTYSQVFVQDLPWGVGGMNVSTQTENMVDDYWTHHDFLYLWDGLEGESLAQQWTANYVTPVDWSHYWLSKGLSRYLSGLYNIHKNGISEFLIWQHSFDQGAYLADWSAGTRQPVVDRHYAQATDITGSNTPYYRGASVMRMLHKHLGDEKWRKALHLFFEKNAHQPVNTEDFRKAIEQASGEPMDWFFDQWVYKTGHPVFEVSKKYSEPDKQLIITVKQTQHRDSISPYPQVLYFQGKIEIEIDGRVESVWLDAKPENVFTISNSGQPKLVNFDFESTWIKEFTFEKTIEEYLYEFQNSKDALARLAAMNSLSMIHSEGKLSGADLEKFRKVLQAVALSNAYWRIRMSAVSQLRGIDIKSTQSAQLDAATVKLLLAVIKKDEPWVRTAAINFLGLTRDAKYTELYISLLSDRSDRVVNAAAVALGRTKSPKAFAALAKLVNRPSWKNQSLMSSLAGLKELGDPRGYAISFEALSDLSQSRWNLPTPPVWDFRIFAAQTIASLKKSEAAYPLIFERFKKSMEENDHSVIFNNALLIATLADPRGQEAFDLLKMKFKDENAMNAIVQYETQFKNAIKSN